MPQVPLVRPPLPKPILPADSVEKEATSQQIAQIANQAIPQTDNAGQEAVPQYPSYRYITEKELVEHSALIVQEIDDLRNQPLVTRREVFEGVLTVVILAVAIATAILFPHIVLMCVAGIMGIYTLYKAAVALSLLNRRVSWRSSANDPKQIPDATKKQLYHALANKDFVKKMYEFQKELKSHGILIKPESPKDYYPSTIQSRIKTMVLIKWEQFNKV